MNKIYKVVVQAKGCYIREVGFMSPHYTLAEVVADNTLTEGKKVNVTDAALTAIYLSEDCSTLFCKDDNAYAMPDEPSTGQIDYILGRTSLTTLDSYDQSNWVALRLYGGGEWNSDIVGYRLMGVTGSVVNRDNPFLTLSEMPTATGEPTDYQPRTGDVTADCNVFLPSSMMGTSMNGVVKNEDFFFVTPKPMEVAVFTWAEWDAENGVMKAVTPVGKNNGEHLTGRYALDLETYYPAMGEAPVSGTVYKFVGVVKRNSGSTACRRAASSDGYTVAALSGLIAIGSTEGTVTGINNIKPAERAVSGVYYIDMMGRRYAEPRAGVMMRVTTFDDGTVSAEKVIIR